MGILACLTAAPPSVPPLSSPFLSCDDRSEAVAVRTLYRPTATRSEEEPPPASPKVTHLIMDSHAVWTRTLQHRRPVQSDHPGGGMFLFLIPQERYSTLINLSKTTRPNYFNTPLTKMPPANPMMVLLLPRCPLQAFLHNYWWHSIDFFFFCLLTHGFI